MAYRERSTIWSEAGELNDKELQLMREAQACKHACERLTREALKHYEQAFTMEQEILRGIAKRLEIDLVKFTVRVNQSSIMVMKAPSILVEGDSIMSKLDMDRDIREYVRRELAGEPQEQT